MPVDLEAMRAIAVRLYAPRVEEEYGSAGVMALRALLAGLHEIHRRVAYERIRFGLTVFVPLKADEVVLGQRESADIPSVELTASVADAATVQVLPGGRFRLWPMAADPSSLADRAVVYSFTDGDYFVLRGELERVPNPTGFPSAFGVPTFVDLNEALEFYGVNLARYSTCHILRQCWFDDRRCYLINRPEAVMRRSLAQHLRSTLRSHELVELREEQNVDETRPVDIKVVWSLTNRLALIEVKWMGNSVNKRGDAPGMRYTGNRAREGAQQLNDYLDSNVQHAPQHVTRGYLVVFDARRRGLNDLEAKPTHQDARYYSNQEVNFNPKFHLLRADFAPPIRFFLEPAA